MTFVVIDVDVVNNDDDDDDAAAAIPPVCCLFSGKIIIARASASTWTSETSIKHRM